jgi:protein-disulfide isomerase
MKRKQIVIAAGGLLLGAFVVASYLYNEQRENEMSAVALASDSPLEREYSQSDGPADAKVVLVEFFDPACETCRVFYAHVKTLLASHPGKVRLVLRYAPFHKGADTMVLILEAARKQGKFWETLDVMYEKQPQWASHHHPQPDLIWQFLPQAGVDVDRIRRDIQEPELVAVLNQDLADARALGVQRTPQFFVNGKPLLNFGYRQLKSLLDAEVAAQYSR